MCVCVSLPFLPTRPHYQSSFIPDWLYSRTIWSTTKLRGLNKQDSLSDGKRYNGVFVMFNEQLRLHFHLPSWKLSLTLKTRSSAILVNPPPVYYLTITQKAYSTCKVSSELSTRRTISTLHDSAHQYILLEPSDHLKVSLYLVLLQLLLSTLSTLVLYFHNFFPKSSLLCLCLGGL